MKHMKSIKILFTALLLMVSTVGFAQASKQTDEEKLAEYQNRVRQTLLLDYSMPDYSVTSINSKVMGVRLAKILEKMQEMSQSQTNLGTLSVIQSRSMEGFIYCTVTNVKFAKATKQGDVITLYFNTILAKNVKNIKKSQIVFQFVDGVSDDVATNDYFINICRYIKE